MGMAQLALVEVLIFTTLPSAEYISRITSPQSFCTTTWIILPAQNGLVSVDRMIFRSSSSFLTLVLALTQCIWAGTQLELQTNAVAATTALLQFYNQTNGLFQTTEWWNSANCITTLALISRTSPQLEAVARKLWNNTFENA